MNLLEAILNLPEDERKAMQQFLDAHAEWAHQGLPEFDVCAIKMSLVRLLEKGLLVICQEGDKIWIDIRPGMEEGDTQEAKL